jgi:cobalt/nickel transport system permease protein
VNSEGFLTRNISGFTRALESVILNEDISRNPGLLQRLDPRIKVVSFVLFIILAGLARNIWILAVIFALILIICLFSKISLTFFLKRVLLFIPVFTALIALPALFITPGEALVSYGRITITSQGTYSAGLLLMRVTDSLSFGVLLILTTPWTNILAALRWFRLPSIIVDILGMTYRYIFLFLHTTNSMFLARRSRTIGTFTAKENRRWLIRALGTTLSKSLHLSEEVYLAMISRGYQGEIRVMNTLAFKLTDFIWAVTVLALAALLLWWNVL